MHSLLLAIITVIMIRIFEPGITPPYQAILLLLFAISTLVTFSIGSVIYLKNRKKNLR
jgi:hypothetical protein